MFGAAAGTCLLHKASNDEKSPGYSKFIYERDAWRPADKALYAARLKQSLKSLVAEVYGEDVITPERTYVLLDVSSDDEEENSWKVPDVVFHYGTAAKK